MPLVRSRHVRSTSTVDKEKSGIEFTAIFDGWENTPKDWRPSCVRAPLNVRLLISRSPGDENTADNQRREPSASRLFAA